MFNVSKNFKILSRIISKKKKEKGILKDEFKYFAIYIYKYKG